MAKITYADKQQAQSLAIPIEKQWRFEDANEVKESVNDLYDLAILEGTDTVEAIDNMSAMTRAEYNSLPLPDPKTVYLIEEDYANSGWNRRVDTTNTQLILIDTLTLISFTGSFESNGVSDLLDSNSKVTPLGINDFIVIDFSATIITPSGTTNYADVQFIVNGSIYRASSFSLLKGAGNDHHISVSFGLPVEEEFYVNGGEFYIISNKEIEIKDRFISVALTHKGI